jgi:thymidylate kinase
LHSWERLPEELPGDLDIAVHPRDRSGLSAAFQALAKAGYRPVQCLNYRAKAYYFVFLWFEGMRPRSMALDIIFEHRRSGLISLRGEQMVAGRMWRHEFWVARPRVEFTYLLAKRTFKGTASPLQVYRLQVLVELLGRAEAEKLAGRIFLGGLKRRVVDACADGSLGELLPKLGAQPWRTGLALHPWGLICYLSGEGARIARRWFQSTGLFVVVLGPDGVGKSTLVVRLGQELRTCFRRGQFFHWRPGVIAPKKAAGAPADDPHGKPPRGALASTLALLGIFLDYWLGYSFILRPLLARTGLVIFDRYYQDLLIDPRRYRYGGPMWLARWIGRLVPPADLLFLVLDAEDEVILSRKREVPLAELQRQRDRYRQFPKGEERATLLNTEQGVESTLGQATRFVAEYLTARFERCHAGWLNPLSGAAQRQSPLRGTR